MCKLSLLLVALWFWFNNSEEKRLKFPQMLVANRQINTESVPQKAVAVFQMGVEPPSKVTGQADVVEFAAPIERINALPVPDILPDNLLVFG